VGSAIAESLQPSEERREKNMANSTSDTGVVGRGFTGFCARFAHGFVREQVLSMLAPLYLLKYRRAVASRVGRS
jgi:hypothetical protein